MVQYYFIVLFIIFFVVQRATSDNVFHYIFLETEWNGTGKTVGMTETNVWMGCVWSTGSCSEFCEQLTSLQTFSHIVQGMCVVSIDTHMCVCEKSEHKTVEEHRRIRKLSIFICIFITILFLSSLLIHTHFSHPVIK